jgi:putative SOS response-associated peptidase YedK
MLTCAPGPDIAPYHDRQIVILPHSQWAAWLGPSPEAPPVGPLPAGSLAITQIR